MSPCQRICNKPRSTILVIIIPTTSAGIAKDKSLLSENQLNSPTAPGQHIQGSNRHAPRHINNDIIHKHMI